MRKFSLNQNLKRGPFYLAISFITGLFVIAMATIYRFVPQDNGVSLLKYQKRGPSNVASKETCEKKELAYDSCASIEKNQNIDYLFVGCNGFF